MEGKLRKSYIVVSVSGAEEGVNVVAGEGLDLDAPIGAGIEMHARSQREEDLEDPHVGRSQIQPLLDHAVLACQ